ncbi:hypothetical protein RHMOL_Rhmol08G0044900 [Rhododendron molle]|uniref:Uncharacterized protein n=1 Tax=Rhododendron molle TaxID=49168 RepID=A0ACC0MK12_RHOML|nr:hypothetical protein RHMOL_Rhmol08G0044900 [Rhododendron molle]
MREITLVLFPYLLISKQPKEEEDTRRARKRKANSDQEGWFLAWSASLYEYSAEESSQIAICFCGLISPASPFVSGPAVERECLFLLILPENPPC